MPELTESKKCGGKIQASLFIVIHSWCQTPLRARPL